MEFEKLARKNLEMLKRVFLVCTINAVKIVARVVTPHRFPDKGII